MKIKIDKRVTEIVEVPLPFYYKFSSGFEMSDTDTYCRITEEHATEIRFFRNFGMSNPSYKVEIEQERSDLKDVKYLGDFYKSNKEEFLKALQDSQEFIDELKYEIENQK